ncbi:MAG: dehydrogenase [Candidatus Hydrogenedentota bacterium]
MNSNLSRRNFVMASAAGLTSALASSRAYGANEKIRIGVIGTGNRGGQIIERAQPHSHAEITALCDVYEPHLNEWKEKLGGTPTTFNDYRALLDAKICDAIMIATPDHWHALQTIHACEAGYDVYCEKPLSFTIVEGRKMVETARRTNRIVQVGMQRRSSAMYAEIRDLVQNDRIGKVVLARAYRLSNMWPNGMGKAQDAAPPADLDWDMWLGPRPVRPYRENIAPYRFRWWKEYSSQMTNWGVHYFDLLRWLMNEEHIESVSTHGGRFVVDDDRTIPDTMEATFEFASGRLMLFGQYEAAGNPMLPEGAEIELRGTKGTLYARTGRYWIVPEAGGQFQDKEPRTDPAEAKSDTVDPTIAHIGNWLECIKSRGLPCADVEIGHRSVTIAHLGNIALEMRARIAWDAEQERITSPESANEHLHYDYRAPWTLG